jgi:hypothetical protein
VNRVRLAAAGYALLLTAACAAGPSVGDVRPIDPLTASTSRTPPRSPTPTTRLANQKVLDNGLTVSLSTPKSFTPTEAAYPHTPRAVAFDMIIENGGGTVYRPEQLAVSALVNGEDAAQVVDSTQGYTGFVGATDEVPPGQTVRVTVAFAVPLDRANLRLVVQPDAAEGHRFTVFEGAV